MKTMTVEDYIKTYCNSKWSEWNARREKMPHRFEQDAYYDSLIYVDRENGIEIVAKYYLGD